MSSLREKRRLLALHKAGKPDEEFDMVNDDGEISDGDEDQRAREGLLLQQDQPQTPPKNPYARAVSKLMKPFKKDATASGTNISGPAQSLVRHDIVTTLTPELSALLGREVIRHAGSIKGRATQNIRALKELLARVPDEQTVLMRHIKGILANEQMNKKGVEMMEDFAEQLRSGRINVRNGTWNNALGRN